MGLFSGLTKSDGGVYQNVGSAATSCGGEPPLVTATPISSSTAAASSSLPTVAEAINISKLAAAGASTSTAAVGAATHNSYSASSQQQRQSDNGSLGRFPTSIDTCPHHCYKNAHTSHLRNMGNDYSIIFCVLASLLVPIGDGFV